LSATWSLPNAGGVRRHRIIRRRNVRRCESRRIRRGDPEKPEIFEVHMAVGGQPAEQRIMNQSSEVSSGIG
jgi:hypothetical protein